MDSAGSAYDPYWSVMPPIMAFYLFQYYPSTHAISSAHVCLGLLLVWAVRLTWNWWQRLGQTWLKDGFLAEDWRYLDFKANTKNRALYWLLFSLGGFHVFPTLLTFVGCMPLWFVLGGGVPPAADDNFGAWSMAGTFFMSTSIVLETVADRQMDTFLASKTKGEVCRCGLWAMSRHPKYVNFPH